MTDTTRTLPVAVVESDPDLSLLVAELLRQAGALAVTFATADDATDAIVQRRVVALVVGVEALRQTAERALVSRTQRSALPVAVLASVPNLEAASMLLSFGPIDHIPIPLPAASLHGRLSDFVAIARERALLIDLRDTLARDWPLSHRLLGYSPAFNGVLRMLPRLGAHDGSVLISGEPGTGRYRLAEVIHDLSGRAADPIVAFDCGGTADAGFDRHLFGDAFERAASGTLVLRDIEEMPLAAQARLVAVLEGGEPALRARVIATSRPDLDQRVGKGRFRQSLYRALSTLHVRAPSLRERREDIPVLANATLTRLFNSGATRAQAFSPKALESLVAAPWPGNVAELEEAVSVAAGRASGAIVTGRDLDGGEPSNAGPFVDTSVAFPLAKAALVERFEQDYARQMLEEHGGNISAAARAAGLDRRSLARLLDRHGFTKGRAGARK